MKIVICWDRLHRAARCIVALAALSATPVGCVVDAGAEGGADEDTAAVGEALVGTTPIITYAPAVGQLQTGVYVEEISFADKNAAVKIDLLLTTATDKKGFSSVTSLASLELADPRPDPVLVVIDQSWNGKGNSAKPMTGTIAVAYTVTFGSIVGGSFQSGDAPHAGTTTFTPP